jgi:hypothetical protein
MDEVDDEIMRVYVVQQDKEEDGIIIKLIANVNQMITMRMRYMTCDRMEVEEMVRTIHREMDEEMKYDEMKEMKVEQKLYSR